MKPSVRAALPAVVAILVAVPTPATASPKTATCTSALQQSGDCVGWSSLTTADPLFSAIRSELALGHRKQARHFFERVKNKMAPADKSVASRALSIAEQGKESARAAQIMNDQEAPAASPAAAAPQQTHGETLATSYYSWVLHGSTSVNVYYGSCSSFTRSCTTGGWWVFDVSINTFFYADGVMLYEHVNHGGGVSARVIDHEARILQDITGSPDSVKSKYGCFTATSTSNECNLYSKPSMSTGNWYYVQIDFVDQPTGYPNSSFQIQTRRWKIVDSTNWQILAYGAGG